VGLFSAVVCLVLPAQLWETAGLPQPSRRRPFNGTGRRRDKQRSGTAKPVIVESLRLNPL
jgi:hypothetical protein